MKNLVRLIIYSFVLTLVNHGLSYSQVDVQEGSSGTDQEVFVINRNADPDGPSNNSNASSNKDAVLRLRTRNSTKMNDWLLHNDIDDNGGALLFSNWTSTNLNIGSNGGELETGSMRMRLNADGNFGIGINPLYKFHIQDGNSQLYFHQSSGSGQNLEFVTWASGVNINTKISNSNLYLNRDSPSSSDLYLGRIGEELIIDGATGNATINGNIDVSGYSESNAIRLMSREQGDLHNSHMLLEVTNGSYGVVRSYDQDQSLGQIHFFDVEWDNGTLSKSSGAINLDGNKGITLGGWDAPIMVIDKINSNVAIGTHKTINNTKLHVDGRVYISEHGGSENGLSKAISTEHPDTDASGINDSYEDYLLWVEEGIVSTDLALVEITGWPDYVFDEEYELSTLDNLSYFIKENGHLPAIPSAEEVEKFGYSLDDMTKRMVKTIEELTLHILAQEKKIKEQNTLIELISSRMATIEEKLK